MMIAGNLDAAAWGEDEIGQAISFGIYALIFISPTLAAGARRLHDTGRSGWWQLLVFTGIGALLLVYWQAQEGDPKENAYGQTSGI